MKNEYWIIGIQVHRKDDEVEFISFPRANKVGMHSKHLVGSNADPVRGPGISMRRNDTEKEFYFLKSGTWFTVKWIWNKPLPPSFIR